MAEQRTQVVILHRAEDAQLHIGERTDGQRDLVGYDLLHELRILETANAMVDAGHAEEIDRFADVGRRAFFARVRDREKTFASCSGEHRSELGGRIADLR